MILAKAKKTQMVDFDEFLRQNSTAIRTMSISLAASRSRRRKIIVSLALMLKNKAMSRKRFREPRENMPVPANPLSLTVPDRFQYIQDTMADETLFSLLYERVRPHLELGRNHGIIFGRKHSQMPIARFCLVCFALTSPPVNLMLVQVLYWLKTYRPFREYEIGWEVSASTLKREVDFMLPILLTAMEEIIPVSWPENPIPLVLGRSELGNGIACHGLIDCTTMYRNRISGVNHLLIRGDKNRPSLTVERTFFLSGLPC
jgi:hypothetical protein